jgi:hypothetical protein
VIERRTVEEGAVALDAPIQTKIAILLTNVRRGIIDRELV